jgi:RNase adaptor protein for sRNA GlmZ degradation
MEFVAEQKDVLTVKDSVFNLIVLLSSQDDDLRFAFGCNAGRHRSPIFVKLLEKDFARENIPVRIRHLELEPL